MNRKNRIDKLTNLIQANIYMIDNHPDLKEALERENEELKKQISELQNPVKVIQKDKLLISETQSDLGWNCMAIQKNGKACTCQRKRGNYCGKHLLNYVKELEESHGD